MVLFICVVIAFRYTVSTTLSNRVGYLNPAWNEPSSKDDSNERFKTALDLAGSELVQYVERLVTRWWPARSIVENAVRDRALVHPSQRIMVLPCACPWKDHIFDIEAEVSSSSELGLSCGSS